MTKPIIVDLPHDLGAEEAKRRIAGNIGQLKDHIPGGMADVESRWEGDLLFLRIRALGQEVDARIDVRPAIVRLEVTLPAFLSAFAGKIEALLRHKGTELLEDRSGKA